MRTVLVKGSAALAVAAAALGACSGSDGSDAAADGVRVVVTTSILGDVVRNLVGDDAEVEVIMPPGSDPHDFAPSPKQAQAMRSADVLVTNGLDFEAALLDTIEAAAGDGAQVVVASDGLSVIGGREQHDGAADPHFFTDPVLMRAAAEHVADRLADLVDGLDSADFRGRVDDYLAALEELDGEIVGALEAVPEDRRVLVTNHEVFTYFAARYDFEVLGTVIPAASTLAEPSAAGLSALADEIARAGVPAIFAETSSPARLAEALAAEGADVDVVELYSESLGERGSDGATYIDMMRTNAQRIAAALTRGR
ncbi:MAG: metal ABC transporter solute-binding protein, Zn/Mn family [Actinomycetota bacterium]